MTTVYSDQASTGGLESFMVSAVSHCLDAPLATDIVRRYVDPSLNVVSVRQMHGGMVNRVCELETDGDPAALVVKTNDAARADAFEREMRILVWYRDHTELPVPRPYACFGGDDGFEGSGLLMERVYGVHLGDARLSSRGRSSLQRELARQVVALHRHTRNTFGSALDPVGHERWLDVFEPTIRGEFDRAKHLISTRARWTIEALLDRLSEWLPEHSAPTLVHGDLWATNILVDDRHPDRPQLTAFIDCGASYCDPEYELAYLRVFRTATNEFFDEYTRHLAIRPGFDQRCRVYWLNTMLQHVRLFGDQYVPRVEGLARQVERLSRR